MPSTLGRAPTSTTAHRRPVERVFAIVCALGLAAGWAWLVHDQPRVNLTISNPGPCPVWVAVATADGTGNINLGSVPAGAERVEARLLDRGAVYRFRFSITGTVVANEAVTRDDLAARGWRYTVPSRPELNPPGCTGT